MEAASPLTDTRICRQLGQLPGSQEGKIDARSEARQQHITQPDRIVAARDVKPRVSNLADFDEYICNKSWIASFIDINSSQTTLRRPSIVQCTVT